MGESPMVEMRRIKTSVKVPKTYTSVIKNACGIEDRRQISLEAAIL